MHAFDFSRLLDDARFASALARNGAADRNVYRRNQGLQFREQGASDGLIQDIVQLAPSAFLFASDYTPRLERSHRQIVSDTDWLHVQFRLDGGGRELVDATHQVETPERSCIVARYPANAVIDRWLDRTQRWRTVCLLLDPTGLTELLDTSSSSFPKAADWLAEQAASDFKLRQLPLHSDFIPAVNSILTCRLEGEFRRALMRAKAIELLIMVIRALEQEASARGCTLKLSDSDREKIALSRNLMTNNLDADLTLAQLARRVGLNRTKLALGFKEVYGISVKAYWRDARLQRARDLLSQPGARIGDVALRMGYGELSSFTRAFSRKFGVLPRECRSTIA